MSLELGHGYVHIWFLTWFSLLWPLKLHANVQTYSKYSQEHVSVIRFQENITIIKKYDKTWNMHKYGVFDSWTPNTTTCYKLHDAYSMMSQEWNRVIELIASGYLNEPWFLQVFETFGKYKVLKLWLCLCLLLLLIDDFCWISGPLLNE